MSKPVDFRNMQQTQFDSGQVIKGSFSELNSALRTVGTNSVLRDAYTHFVQTLDINNRPIQVEYYQATVPVKDKLVFVADVGGSLQDTWFSITSSLTKTLHVFHYIVDGNGSAPVVPNAVFHPVNIDSNDPSNVVRLATQYEIQLLSDFSTNNPEPLSNELIIEYLQFGDTAALDVQSTGFTATRVQQGNSRNVGSILISYDVDGNPIYNGQTLFGMVYNVSKAEFERSISLSINNLTVDVDLDAFSVTPDSTLAVGSENGQANGTKFAFVNNIKQCILAAHDREQNFIYADFGTKNERIIQIDYTSSTFPGVTASKVITYTLIGTKYRRDSIDWVIS